MIHQTQKRPNLGRNLRPAGLFCRGFSTRRRAECVSTRKETQPRQRKNQSPPAAGYRISAAGKEGSGKECPAAPGTRGGGCAGPSGRSARLTMPANGRRAERNVRSRRPCVSGPPPGPGAQRPHKPQGNPELASTDARIRSLHKLQRSTFGIMRESHVRPARGGGVVSRASSTAAQRGENHAWASVRVCTVKRDAGAIFQERSEERKRPERPRLPAPLAARARCPPRRESTVH